jgi:hypothetical protein
LNENQQKKEKGYTHYWFPEIKRMIVYDVALGKYILNTGLYFKNPVNNKEANKSMMMLQFRTLE